MTSHFITPPLSRSKGWIPGIKFLLSDWIINSHFASAHHPPTPLSLCHFAVMMCSSDAWTASLRRAGMQICVGLFLTEMSLTSFRPVSLEAIVIVEISRSTVSPCSFLHTKSPSDCYSGFNFCESALKMLKHTSLMKMCNIKPQQLQHPSGIPMCHRRIHQVHAWNQKAAELRGAAGVLPL